MNEIEKIRIRQIVHHDGFISQVKAAEICQMPVQNIRDAISRGYIPTGDHHQEVKRGKQTLSFATVLMFGVAGRLQKFGIPLKAALKHAQTIIGGDDVREDCLPFPGNDRTYIAIGASDKNTDSVMLKIPEGTDAITLAKVKLLAPSVDSILFVNFSEIFEIVSIGVNLKPSEILKSVYQKRKPN